MRAEHGAAPRASLLMVVGAAIAGCAGAGAPSAPPPAPAAATSASATPEGSAAGLRPPPSAVASGAADPAVADVLRDAGPADAGYSAERRISNPAAFCARWSGLEAPRPCTEGPCLVLRAYIGHARRCCAPEPLPAAECWSWPAGDGGGSPIPYPFHLP